MFEIPELRIGVYRARLPIIQGGMGVRVSGASLASAVANEGCIGVISSVGLGSFEDYRLRADCIQANIDGLRDEIRRARSLSDGIIAVNIMCALANYIDLVETSVAEGVDMIISGAGLPLDLPKYVPDPKIALVPIVSTHRALKLICRRWEKAYSRLPDAVVVEGPKAGGHLGFSHKEINDGSASSLEEAVTGVIEYVNTLDNTIPVIAAGGIFDGADIVHFLEMGASGVQMATRFVCTDECDVHQNFKQAYIDARREDLVIIKSPVGLPGRVIRNGFVDRVLSGEKISFDCRYKCLSTCDPASSPYCIAKVLANAAKGYSDESFCFAGSNAYRCTEIVSVKKLVTQLVEEIIQYQTGLCTDVYKPDAVVHSVQ